MFAFAMLMALAAPSEVVLTDDQIQQMTMMSSGRQAQATGEAQLLKGKAQEAVVRAAMSGQTRAVLVRDFGIYLVYAAPDGSLAGWFPGRPEVVHGTWGVQKLNSKSYVFCQRFERPATPRSGPYLPGECQSAADAMGGRGVLGRWDGDPFALASGTIPFVKQPMGLPRP